MYKNLIGVVRVAVGVIILLFGIIGLFLPVLQGGLLILVAVPLIHPESGKKLITKVKEKFHATHRRYTHR